MTCIALFGKIGGATFRERLCSDSLGSYVALRVNSKCGAGVSSRTLVTRLRKIQSSYKFVESKIIANPQNQRFNDWHFRLLKQREKLLLFNKRYWGTLGRKKWLIDGDRNSRYFHQSAKTRNRNCSILRIKDPSGIWIEDPAVIRQQFLQDYT